MNARTIIARALNALADRLAPLEPANRKAEWMGEALTARARWEVAPPAWTGMSTAGVLPDGRAYWTGVDMDDARARQDQALSALNVLAASAMRDEARSRDTIQGLVRTVRAAL